MQRDAGDGIGEEAAEMVIDLIAGAAILGLVVYRQLRTYPVSSASMRLPLIVAVIGVLQLASFLKSDHAHAAVIASLLGSLVLAAIFGLARAATVRIWRQGGQAWAKGSWLTGVLWVVSLAAHLGYDALVTGSATGGHGGLGSASILLYLAVTFTLQRLAIRYRAERIGPAGGAAPDGNLAAGRQAW